MVRVLAERPLRSGLIAMVVMSEILDGDLAVDDPDGELDRRRSAVVPRPWSWLRQVHGVKVVVVSTPGDCAGSEADASVTTRAGCPLGVQVADCAPVALLADGGGIAVVHVGWRGLRDGVLDAAARALGRIAEGPQRAVVGPCIHPCCYEFGEADLDVLVGGFGSAVRQRTMDGRPSLDLPAAVGVALGRFGVDDVWVDGACTGCDPRYWSFRVSGRPQRQAMVAWLQWP